MTNDCEVSAEERREAVFLGAGTTRPLESVEVTAAVFRLAIAKKILTAELNRLMFSVSHRRYLQVVRRLERVSRGIDQFMRQ